VPCRPTRLLLRCARFFHYLAWTGLLMPTGWVTEVPVATGSVSAPLGTAHIDGMCYGGKHAWSRRAARTRSSGLRGQGGWQREPPVRPGRLPVCRNRRGSLHNHVARWRSRGGSGVGFRTPARAHPYHYGLASGPVREPHRRPSGTALSF
jgi:hypothetical protein